MVAFAQGAWEPAEDEGFYLPNRQTNLVIALHTLCLLFRNLLNTTAYHLGRSSPSTKDLHG